MSVYGYSEIHCIRLKSRYNEIQSLLYSLNLTLDTMRYNVSGPSLDTMVGRSDTHFLACSWRNTPGDAHRQNYDAPGRHAGVGIKTLVAALPCARRLGKVLGCPAASSCPAVFSSLSTVGGRAFGR